MGERLAIDPRGEPDPRVIRRAAELLGAGEVIAGPSDTVYGFLARPGSAAAAATLARLKGREDRFLLVADGVERVRALVSISDDALWPRLAAVWPGPVTVVLPRRPEVAWTTAPTLAVRVPDHRFLRAVIAATGEALVSTSANRRGKPPALDADTVWREFSREIPLVVDGGAATVTRPSTLVDCTTHPPRILREGSGDVRALLDPSFPRSLESET